MSAVDNFRLRLWQDNLRYQEKPLQDFITNEDINKIYTYLKNPISNGIWVLEGIWLENEGITNKIVEIIKEIEKEKNESKKKEPEDAGKKVSQINIPLQGDNPIGEPKIVALEENSTELDKTIIKTANGITFTFALFVSLTYSKAQEKEKFERYLGQESILLIDTIKEKVRGIYSKEIDYFKNNIICPAFGPTGANKTFIYVKDGLILDWQSDPTESNKRPIRYFSLEFEPLHKISEFYKSIGKLGEFNIYPIYSPEDEVFEPYTIFLKLGISKIFEQGKIQDLILQSISTFEQENYAYCISTIGLVFEEQLTQIYETIFRVKCPQGLTLGGLLDLINSDVKDKDPNKAKKTSVRTFEYSDIYKKINSLIIASDSGRADNKEVLMILRDMLTITRENNSSIQAQLKSSDNSNESFSIFPANIIEGMNELIRYRNAISHRSRTPVGSFEATKSISDIASLSMWWRNEKKLVNWINNPQDIIGDMVKRNNPNSYNIIQTHE